MFLRKNQIQYLIIFTPFLFSCFCFGFLLFLFLFISSSSKQHAGCFEEMVCITFFQNLCDIMKNCTENLNSGGKIAQKTEKHFFQNMSSL